METYLGIKDKQLVTEDGKIIQADIEGLIIYRTPPVEDERGEVVEIYRESWGLHPDPLVYAYMATLRPKVVKGWVVHKLQDDRIFTIKGTQLWVFFDSRESSPSYKQLAKYTISERNRAMIVIPRGVYHAVQNVGTDEAQFLNLPNMPYNKLDPDKYRLPIKNDLIPFEFNT